MGASKTVGAIVSQLVAATVIAGKVGVKVR